jgi:hypothetical protein
MALRKLLVPKAEDRTYAVVPRDVPDAGGVTIWQCEGGCHIAIVLLNEEGHPMCCARLSPLEMLEYAERLKVRSMAALVNGKEAGHA